jgi:hypothetical protein
MSLEQIFLSLTTEESDAAEPAAVETPEETPAYD